VTKGYMKSFTPQTLSFIFFQVWVSLAPLRSHTSRNLLFKQVEGQVQGEEELVEKLIADIHKGPSHALVEKIDRRDLDVVDGEADFEVRA
jgi:hypothetical protein